MNKSNVITTLTGVTDLRLGVEAGTRKPCIIVDTVGGKHYITLDAADPFAANRIASRVFGFNIGFDDSRESEATYPALRNAEVLNG